MSDAMFSVQDQVVLISGATRGIGRAIAEGFARGGAKVVITGRVSETGQKAAEEMSAASGGTVVAKVCDVADAPASQRLVDEVLEQFGRINTLVNCAGVNKRMPVEQYDEETYDFITNINVRGAFFLATAVGRHMIEAGGGSQINIDSINSHTPLNRVTVYAMAKAAMRQMTKCLAMEWGPHGIRVNGIGPGFTETELAKPLWEKRPEMNAWRVENTPLRRIGQPQDMVGAAIFLASDAASFVTGQTLYIDGGTLCGLFWPIDE